VEAEVAQATAAAGVAVTVAGEAAVAEEDKKKRVPQTAWTPSF